MGVNFEQLLAILLLSAITHKDSQKQDAARDVGVSEYLLFVSVS